MFAEISESNTSSLGVYIPVSRFITECEADTTPKTQCCTCSSQIFLHWMFAKYSWGKENL